MEEGIANIFMITTHKTILKCKITKNVSKKKSKGHDLKHNKTKNRFFEEIVAKLRQVDVLLSQGKSVGEAVRTIGVTQFTYYRWRKEFGGLKGDQVKRLKELEKENNRLRKAVSDLTLEKLILKEAASGNF